MPWSQGNAHFLQFLRIITGLRKMYCRKTAKGPFGLDHLHKRE